jgi:hypothetical protein
VAGRVRPRPHVRSSPERTRSRRRRWVWDRPHNRRR